MKRISKTQKILNMLAHGKSVKDIAKKLGTSANYVYFVRWNEAKKGKTTKKNGKAKTAVIRAKQEKKVPTPYETVSDALLRLRAEDEAELVKKTDEMWSQEEMFPVVDNINHPPHYTYGGIETIDFIEAKALNYNRGNALKYLTRAGFKDFDNELEDLKKAEWYIKREISRVEQTRSV